MSKMDKEIEDALEGINDARPIASWAPNLEVGVHQELVLVSYKIKPTLKAGRVIEAEFLVIVSDVHKPGEIRGWSWFIDGKGWGGDYAKARNQTFTLEMGKCLDDERLNEPNAVKLIGRDLFLGKGLGVCIGANVTVAVKKGVVQKREDGSTITNADWKAISQTAEDVNNTIVEFKLAPQTEDDDDEEPAPARAAAAPTPATEPTPARSSRFAGARR